MGGNGNILKLFKGFSSNRHQRVAFNGWESTWADVAVVVLQESIVYALFFPTLKVLNLTGIKFCNFRYFSPFLRNVPTKSFETTKSVN